MPGATRRTALPVSVKEKKVRGAVVMTNSYGQECVSVRGAAKILKLSHTRVAQFVSEGRLPAEKVPGIQLMMVPLYAVLQFTPNPTGRPRKVDVIE